MQDKVNGRSELCGREVTSYHTCGKERLNYTCGKKRKLI